MVFLLSTFQTLFDACFYTMSRDIFFIVFIGKHRKKYISSIFLEIEALTSFLHGDFFHSPITLKVLKKTLSRYIKAHSILLVLNILSIPKT